MPRILPRLLKELAKSGSESTLVLPLPSRPYKKRRIRTATPLPPSLHPANYTRSLLLSPRNPVTARHIYQRHKSPPTRRTNAARLLPEDAARWCDPYMRMLATPLRECIFTRHRLPAAFLVRIAPMTVPGSDTSVILPDGLEHPAFCLPKAGRGFHVLCRRDAFNVFIDQTLYKRIIHHAHFYAHTVDHIAHLLRIRVLQELEILAASLTSAPRLPRVAPVRRLTRAEWAAIQETGVLPDPHAVAVVVAPPPNRDPVTHERPAPSLSTAPPIAHTPLSTTRPLPPLSTLLAARPPSAGPAPVPVLVTARTPLYHGLTLFPAPAQRAALHNVLTRLLALARPPPVLGAVPPDSRASHAFLLTADPADASRGDVAAVAMALWRVRMFEGAGWDEPAEWLRIMR